MKNFKTYLATFKIYTYGIINYIHNAVYYNLMIIL